MNITDTIQFDESKLLSEQTPEFQAWYNENVNVLINDKLAPDSLDKFKRPFTYTVYVDNFTFVICPNYIYKDQSNWACSDFQITIKTVS